LHAVKRRAFPFAEACDPNVIFGASFGEDMALTRVGLMVIALANAFLCPGRGEK
jgi:hypothetical protein